MDDTTLRDEVRAAEHEIASGRPEDALARAQQLQARYPRALIAQRVLGEVYLALRKPREALGALERALAGDPEDARACCARALIHQIHGDAIAALAWYRRACEIRPEDAMLRAAYRELATPLGQPAYRPTSVGLARLFLRGDLFTHAIREWENILSQEPDRLDAQVGLAETLWRAGDNERAGAVARHIVANTGTSVKALLIVAALEHAAGHDDETQRLLQRALELDPERRIGRALYADRFARGDVGLQTLFLGRPGEAGAASAGSGRLTGPLDGKTHITEAPTTHMPTPSMPAPSSRPRTGPLPPLTLPSLTPPGTGPLTSPGTLPPAAQADLEEVSEFAQSRTTSISPSFHQIFAETEFMLWGRDDDDGHQANGVPVVPAGAPPDPFERSRAGERFERSTVIVPPALAGSEGGVEDTESRAAIGWVRWLQAQGARPMEGVTRISGGQRPAGGTGPLSPTREALREMFAELDPATRVPRVVEGELAPASNGASQAGATGGEPVETSAEAFAADAGREAADGSSWAASGEHELEHRLDAHEQAAGQDVEPPSFFVAGGYGSQAHRDARASAEDTAPESASAAAGAVTTLEDLNRQFASSGFREFEVHPGALASLAEAETPAPTAAPPGAAWEREETAGSRQPWGVWGGEPVDQPASGHAALAPEAELAAEPEPVASAQPREAAPVADGDDDIAGDDYMSRLRRARRRRAQGRVEDALLEYRGLLRDSPDTLDDLIHDLRDMSADTEHAEVHRLLGDVYIREGNYVSALESYNRALALSQGQGG